jgi:biotin carboxylase
MAEALSLPFHSAEVIRLTRHKAEMRRTLAAAGLDDTPARLVEGAGQVGRFGEEFGYPFVLKPVDGRGSLGIAIVRAEHDIKKAIENYGAHASMHRMLAEAFLEGEEYSIEAFSEKGAHRVVCVTQKFKDPVTCIETGHCIPAPIDEAVRERLARFVISALDAIGLKDGPSHTEVIDTTRGPKMVETHARLAGDSIVELIRLTSGVDLDELWVRQVCGESVLDQVPQRQTCFASVSFATPQARGKLERIDGLDEARALPGVRTVESLQDPGAELEGAYDSFSRGAFAIATGSTAHEATGRARAATAKLRFLIACSDSSSSVGKPKRQ